MLRYGALQKNELAEVYYFVETIIVLPVPQAPS